MCRHIRINDDASDWRQRHGLGPVVTLKPEGAGGFCHELDLHHVALIAAERPHETIALAAIETDVTEPRMLRAAPEHRERAERGPRKRREILVVTERLR